MAHCDNFFLWGSKNNLHKTDSAADGANRNYPPDANYMKGLVALAQPKGVAGLPEKDWWKPMSEKNKPVLISPIKTNQVVLKRNGKVIATLPFYDKYTDGRWRYYTKGVQGFQLGAGLELWINNVKQGLLNGAFRENGER